jgi:hypothetical protein
MMGKPGPMPAPWPSPPVWPTPATGTIESFEYGFRGDDLFAQVSDRATFKNEFVWFHRGLPEPIHIPLNFELNDDAAGVYKKIQDAEPAVTKQFLEIPIGGRRVFGPSGIFFVVRRLGFYFLSYTDIAAYLKAHSNITIADAPPVPTRNSGQNTSASTVSSQSFLGKFKGRLVVLKDGHLQTAAPGALNGVKYVTILFAASWYKPSREIMGNLPPFIIHLKTNIRNTR